MNSIKPTAALSVSIVIVTRNRMQDLLRCLQSIEAQHYPNLEIIIVDNASTDRTAETLKATYPSITLLAQDTNLGAPAGRNIGIGHAAGNICLCIDDDAELIDPETISKAMEYFDRNPKLACLSLLVLNPDGKVVRKLIPRRDRKQIKEDTQGAMFSATGCFLRKSAFIDTGGFWEKLSPYFGEEPELSFRLLDKGYDILLAAHIAVKHHHTQMERCPDRRLYFGVRNTPWLALRNLPWYSVLSLTLFSWAYFFIIALVNRQLPVFFRAIPASIKAMPEIRRIRKPVNKNTRKILWKYSGVFIY